jgi:hypothetical protein
MRSSIADLFLKAILHLADKERRSQMAAKLLFFMVDYVAAERFLEACVIRDCALAMNGAPDESNAFLFEMFQHGYFAWVAEQNARDKSFLRQAGFDLEEMHKMSLEEIDACISRRSSDPEAKANLEKLFQENSEQRDLAVRWIEGMRKATMEILNRQDARELLLSQEELDPWAKALNEKIVRSQENKVCDNPSEAALDHLFQEAILPLVREMARTVFTPERIQKLVSQLDSYRRQKFADGVKPVAALAQTAMDYVKDEQEPDLNSFLLALCYHSLCKFGEDLCQ